jgi:hypothetical protein
MVLKPSASVDDQEAAGVPVPPPYSETMPSEEGVTDSPPLADSQALPPPSSTEEAASPATEAEADPETETEKI